MMRRQFTFDLARACATLSLASIGVRSDEPAARSKVVFVAASDAEPYTRALEGFRSVFPNVTSIVLDEKDPLHTPALPSVLTSSVALVIAAGGEAVQAVKESKNEAPLLATMVLQADRQSRASWPPLVVHLDTAPSAVASEIANLFPNRHRIALLWRGSASTDASARTSKTALAYERAGIQTIDCAAPGNLLPAFLSLRGRTDFVMTTPDGSLYNSATVKPLILASIEHRLPIIGFSESFVRSGAAVGIYPDFRDIGLQTAALAEKFLSGDVHKASEEPRTTIVAVNQRILRLLGLEYKQHPGLVVYR